MGRDALTFGVEGGGGVVQKRESPDFRFPEVGISSAHADPYTM